MTETTALKNYIDRTAIKRLAQCIVEVDPTFDYAAFTKVACRGLAPLEFTARTQHVAKALRQHLPDDMVHALGLIRDALPPPLDGDEGMFSERFWLWPLSDFVRDYGSGYWRESLDTCYRLTQSFTAEFALRPLIARDPEKTLKVLQAWTQDESHHVRRLCSEGSRPRLPWASRLDLPRSPIGKILSALKSDPSKYVQKSVANHLNDIGKTDPDWLIDTMTLWNQRASKQTRWIINHALRTQIKAGSPKALALIGFEQADLANAKLMVAPKTIKIGEQVTASLRLDSGARETQSLLIDWVMHYARKDGGQSRKVFKGKSIELETGSTFEWKKSFAMIPRRTRSLYAGEHRLDVQVNGDIVATATFKLKAD